MPRSPLRPLILIVNTVELTSTNFYQAAKRFKMCSFDFHRNATCGSVEPQVLYRWKESNHIKPRVLISCTLKRKILRVMWASISNLQRQPTLDEFQSLKPQN